MEIQRMTKVFLHIFYIEFGVFLDKFAQIQAVCGFRGF